MGGIFFLFFCWGGFLKLSDSSLSSDLFVGVEFLSDFSSNNQNRTKQKAGKKTMQRPEKEKVKKIEKIE